MCIFLLMLWYFGFTLFDIPEWHCCMAENYAPIFTKPRQLKRSRHIFILKIACVGGYLFAISSDSKCVDKEKTSERARAQSIHVSISNEC